VRWRVGTRAEGGAGMPEPAPPEPFVELTLATTAPGGARAQHSVRMTVAQFQAFSREAKRLEGVFASL